METEHEKTNGAPVELPSWFRVAMDRWQAEGESRERSRAAEHCSPSIVKLAGALAKAQAVFKQVTRNRTVTVTPRKRQDGSQPSPYTFTYATLDEVLAATVPALTANGLSITSLPMMETANRPRILRTVLLHESGEFIAVELPLPENDEGPQGLGKAITYLRRYSITSLLGVAAEEDDDGNGAEGNEMQPRQREQRPQTAKPEPAAPAGPWRAKEDDGTGIMEGEIEEFDELIKRLQWKPNFVTVFLSQRFGVHKVGDLTRHQFKAVAKLLMAHGSGKEVYQKALSELTAAGQVKP